MSSTTQKLSLGQAPWSESFKADIAKLESPEFVLATMHPTASDNPVETSEAQTQAAAPFTFAPRARFCIYRGMWASLPENRHNDAPRNKAIYTSDMPTFTTDARMSKVAELFATCPGQATSTDQIQGSGAGGPVEAVWWVKEAKAQWRLRGRAYVIDSEDIDNHRGDIPGAVSSGVRVVRSEVGKRMRLVAGETSAEEQDAWSWGTEVTGHFGNCSPFMRGTFKNPPPGTPIPSNTTSADKTKHIGEKVTSLDDKTARANFRVVVIRPDEVERLDTGEPEQAKRILWTFRTTPANTHTDSESEKPEPEVTEVGDWTVEELWP